MSKPLCAVFLTGVLLSACSHNGDSVTFVTSTQIGIDADPATQQLDIGYSRIEGVIGPVYKSGAIPPVYAELESNLNLFNPEVKQFYATGDAAEIATGDSIKQPDHERYKLTGERKTMFFGTSSNFGLRAAFKAGSSPSVSLGYKRQELSIIPVINNDAKGDEYGSTYARIDMGAEISEFNKTGVELSQMFATGRAADQLAQNKAVQAKLAAKAAAAAEVSCGAASSQAAQKLQSQITGSSANRNALKAWLGNNNLQHVSPTTFAYGDCFPNEHIQAVADLGW